MTQNPGQELVVYEPNPAALALVGDPEAALEGAARAAKALIRMVDQTKSYSMIQGNKHLRVEAWQTVGAFYGITVRLPQGGTRELLNDLDGAFQGFEAYAEALHNGVVVGGATARCLVTERNWRDRERNQIASMAQTRATSKALRTVLAWVVVLAGYEATPAEEMVQDAAAVPPRRNMGNVRVDVIEGEVVPQQKPRINNPDSPVSEAQVRAIHMIARAKGWGEDDLQLHEDTIYGVNHTNLLTKGQAGELIDYLNNGGRPQFPPIADEQAELIPAPKNLH